MTIENMREMVKEKFINHVDRYIHTIGVRDTAVLLARNYGIDQEKTEIAALFHDYFKYEPYDIMLKYVEDEEIEKYKYLKSPYHGIAASNYLKKELKIDDIDILNAIRFHVLGRKNMSILEKIIFVSDFSEPNRMHKSSIIVYKQAFINLDYAVYLSMKYTREYLEKKGYKVADEQTELEKYYKGEHND